VGALRNTLPAVVLLLAGCGLLGRERVYAPVLERVPEGAWPFALPSLEHKPAESGEPLTLQAFLLSARPSLWRKLAVDLERGYQVLTPQEFSAVSDALLKGRRASPMLAPRLVIQPGRVARVSMLTTRMYLGDYELPRDPRDRTVKPAPRRVFDGIVLDAEGHGENGAVVLTRLEARMATGLGMRDCQTWIDVGTDVAILLWQEPVVLAATASLPRDARPRLRAGQALLLPMRQALVVAKARVRARAEYPIEVRNERSLRFLRKVTDQGYPLPERLVLLLTPMPSAPRPR